MGTVAKIVVQRMGFVDWRPTDGAKLFVIDEEAEVKKAEIFGVEGNFLNELFGLVLLFPEKIFELLNVHDLFED